MTKDKKNKEKYVSESDVTKNADQEEEIKLIEKKEGAEEKLIEEKEGAEEKLLEYYSKEDLIDEVKKMENMEGKLDSCFRFLTTTKKATSDT